MNDLPRIKVPTLIIAGKLGTMSPDDIKRMGKPIPSSRVILTSGSHLEMYDAQDEYFWSYCRAKNVRFGSFVRLSVVAP